MRKKFCEIILREAKLDERIVVLTGDLGYLALEPVQKALGARFINCGIAEQNMVSVAAGLARQGFRPWLYSIAPFLTFRPFEQIRNDIGLHGLPVRLVGNGGGYGYGIMGATHHALEDVGAMRLMPNFTVYAPAFDSDIEAVIPQMNSAPGPAYLRLNVGIQGTPKERFRPWRRLAAGTKGVVACLGTVAGEVLKALSEFPPDTFSVYSVGYFPLSPPPREFWTDLEGAKRLTVVEEHVQAGGLGEALAKVLLENSVGPLTFSVLGAQGYPSGKYGSQAWHLAENGLSGPTLITSLRESLK